MSAKQHQSLSLTWKSPIYPTRHKQGRGVEKYICIIATFKTLPVSFLHSPHLKLDPKSLLLTGKVSNAATIHIVLIAENAEVYSHTYESCHEKTRFFCIYVPAKKAQSLISAFVFAS